MGLIKKYYRSRFPLVYNFVLINRLPQNNKRKMYHYYPKVQCYLIHLDIDKPISKLKLK